MTKTVLLSLAILASVAGFKLKEIFNANGLVVKYDSKVWKLNSSKLSDTLNVFRFSGKSDNKGSIAEIKIEKARSEEWVLLNLDRLLGEYAEAQINEEPLDTAYLNVNISPFMIGQYEAFFEKKVVNWELFAKTTVSDKYWLKITVKSPSKENAEQRMRDVLKNINIQN